MTATTTPPTGGGSQAAMQTLAPKPAVSQAIVACGSVLNVNPDRICLKRIILTGYPVKVKKRTATVKYMFYPPDDIRWFRPVELFTKWGLQGSVKESLGTHGLYKAYFTAPIQQNDTVCMPLYKRVFPKLVDFDYAGCDVPAVVGSEQEGEEGAASKKGL